VDQDPDDVIPSNIREQRDKAGFDWDSPRWRIHDAASQGVVELDGRFRNVPAPHRRGAIDDFLTIVGEKR
jgi:hypothetical protein